MFYCYLCKMNLNIQPFLPANFSDSSRVWIYQGSRSFLPTEVTAINKTLNEFVTGWKSHGAAVKGSAHLFFERFIVLMADESDIMIGGCSTDSSVLQRALLREEQATGR